MKYSIIITFYSNIIMLKNCIHTLMLTLKDRPDIEVLVINDNPQIKLECDLSSLHELFSFRVIQMSQNRGHSGACNVGVNNSQGDYLIFMDCDIIVTEGWLVALEKVSLQHPNWGAISSTILNFSNDQIVYFGMEPYKSETIKPFQGAYRKHSFLLQDFCCTIVTAGCMMISRDIYVQVGGFDEIFYNSCNDLDLSMKLRASGYQNYVAANSIVFHRGNVSGEIRFSSHIYARSLFFQKWGSTFQPENTLKKLGNLYAQQFVASGDYMVINFSTSLFSKEYITCLYGEKRITPIDTYTIRPKNGKIILTDYLLWDIAQLRIPILYYVDDYRNVIENYLWFQVRNGQGDIIADRNGNVIAK